GLVRRSCRPSDVTYGELFRDESPPRSGFSTLMTRAPRLARSRVAYGPARAVVRSMTVLPARGPGAFIFTSVVMHADPQEGPVVVEGRRESGSGRDGAEIVGDGPPTRRSRHGHRPRVVVDPAGKQGRPDVVAGELEHRDRGVPALRVERVVGHRRIG